MTPVQADPHFSIFCRVDLMPHPKVNSLKVVFSDRPIIGSDGFGKSVCAPCCRRGVVYKRTLLWRVPYSLHRRLLF